MNSKNRNKTDVFKQIVSLVEDVKDEVKLNNKQLTKKKNIPRENPFDFTEFVKKPKDDDEIDLGLFLEIAAENKIINNQTPVNTLIDEMEKLENSFSTSGYFTLGDNEEIDNNRLFTDSNELAKFIHKILDKHDDHPSIYYTGNIYRFFRAFKRVF